MKCVHAGCSGLLICDLTDDVFPWKCSSCSRRYDDHGKPSRVDGTPEKVVKSPLPDIKIEPKFSQCQGRQGRGRCKKETERGSEYCRYHNGQSAKLPVTVSSEMPVQKADQSSLSTSKVNGARRAIHAHLEKIRAARMVLDDQELVLRKTLRILSGVEMDEG